MPFKNKEEMLREFNKRIDGKNYERDLSTASSVWVETEWKISPKKMNRFLNEVWDSSRLATLDTVFGIEALKAQRGKTYAVCPCGKHKAILNYPIGICCGELLTEKDLP